MNRPLTRGQRAILTFVEEHPMCSASEIDEAFSDSEFYTGHHAWRWGMESMIGRRLVEVFEEWSDAFGGRYVRRYRRSLRTEAHP